MSIKPDDEKSKSVYGLSRRKLYWPTVRRPSSYMGFHPKFNSYFYTPHSDIIYSFLEILTKIQIDTNILIQTSNHIPKKIRSVNEKNIILIEENLRKYKTEQISRYDYVKTMALKSQPKK